MHFTILFLFTNISVLLFLKQRSHTEQAVDRLEKHGWCRSML